VQITADVNLLSDELRCVLTALCVAKYKTLEKLVNTTELPALVEQKRAYKQTDDTHHVDVPLFEKPLTLTEKFEQTYLVVNCINDGKTSIGCNTLRHTEEKLDAHTADTYKHWS